jgi:hypothetical protein
MPERKAIRYLVVTAAMVTLLVFAATLGSVFHHHASSTDTNCSICHLTHQPIERPHAVHRAPAVAAVGMLVEAQEPEFVSSPVAPRLPARAPPSA